MSLETTFHWNSESLTAGAGTRCMSLLPTSPTLPLVSSLQDYLLFSNSLDSCNAFLIKICNEKKIAKEIEKRFQHQHEEGLERERRNRKRKRKKKLREDDMSLRPMVIG